MFDLSTLMMDFTQCPKGTKLTDHFIELSAFKEFTEVKDENIIKIAIATADIESPFLKIKDRETMLKSLFEFLKISISNKKEQAFFDSIMTYKSVPYMSCFGKYLVLLHEIDWTEYQTTKQTHEVLTMDSMRPMDENEKIDDFVKRKVNIQNHLKKVGAELKALEAKIYPDSRAAREVALNESRKIKTYAEKYAESNTFA